MNLNDLRSFVRVVELGTFAAAAKDEGVPRSTITRRIARLEEAVGVELVRRSARAFVLTEDGRRLHRLTSGAMRELANAALALETIADQPRGKLVVAAPDFGRTETFARLMVTYRRRFPEVELEFRIDNRVVDLVHEGVDVAFRAYSDRIPGTSDLMSRVYDLPPASFYASPDYLERRGTPASLADLRDHDYVSFSAPAGSHITLTSSTATERFEFPAVTLSANDMLLVRALIESGGGVALLPNFVAEPSVERGALTGVLSQWSLDSGRIALVWPSSRHLAPRIRAFVELAGEFLTQTHDTRD
ncbi:MAG: LysR family transcriptional regulator [Myxococcota bacterium]